MHRLNTTGRAILDIFELERMHAPVQALSKFYSLTISKAGRLCLQTATKIRAMQS
mgnify:CR=1 FL=1